MAGLARKRARIPTQIGMPMEPDNLQVHKHDNAVSGLLQKYRRIVVCSRRVLVNWCLLLTRSMATRPSPHNYALRLRVMNVRFCRGERGRLSAGRRS